MNTTIGLVINPIAGVGAALAWKGTDDVDKAWKAIENGQEQPIWDIVKRALSRVPSTMKISWVLGGEYPLALDGKVVYDLPERSQAEDTKNAVSNMLNYDPDLILFAGGDGTAADIASVVSSIPILGIPGGVKIFSPCFLHRPEDLGDFLANWEGDTMKVDLLDLDEEEYQRGQAKPKLISSVLIPISSTIQSGKSSWTGSDSDTFKFIAERIKDDKMLEGTILVGPGSTMKNIFSHFELELSLLGVDVVSQGKLVAKDCTKAEIEDFKIDEIWLTPIGNQGHIFGRGNRQIPTQLVKKIGKNNIKIFSTMEKIRNTEALYVDTGDLEVDNLLKGYLPVIVGYHNEIIKKVK